MADMSPNLLTVALDGDWGRDKKRKHMIHSRSSFTTTRWGPDMWLQACVRGVMVHIGL